MQSPRKPLLRFEDGAWRGEDTEYDVILTDQALQREASRYLARAETPSTTTREQALLVVREVAYWHGFAWGTISDIHVRQKPEAGR